VRRRYSCPRWQVLVRGLQVQEGGQVRGYCWLVGWLVGCLGWGWVLAVVLLRRTAGSWGGGCCSLACCRRCKQQR
jgi:hypothetical protein